MAGFLGEYNYSIDTKGRVSVPAKFRHALSEESEETFVVCEGPSGCLRAYPKDTWEDYEKELFSRPQTQKNLKLMRRLRSSLSDTAIDSQGRISLNNRQLSIAGIGKKVVLVGNYGYIEIWDAERYEEYMNQVDDFDELFFESEQGKEGKNKSDGLRLP